MTYSPLSWSALAALILGCGQRENSVDGGKDTAILSCFVAGTRVLTDRGPRAIETLQAGDQVWAWNTSQGTPILRTVAQIIRGESTETYHLQAGEQVIRGVTAEHPFWVPQSGQWKTVADLETGMDVLGWLGQHEAKALPIAHLERTRHAQPTPVFTLSVEGPEHNFFAEGVLVHNKSQTQECFRIELPDGKLVEFGDGVVNKTIEIAVPLNVIWVQNCDGLSLDERLLQFELDSPLGGFSAPPESLDLGASEGERTLTLDFSPTEIQAYEAQLHLLVPHTTHQLNMTLQLFGEGVATEE